MLDKTGVPTSDDLASVTPSKERRLKGPVAVIECFQKIPCNPCYTSCKKGAIAEMVDINQIPVLDFDKCNGCGICVTNCPGLAIVIVDESYSDTEALVKIPFEFLPLPNEGDTVTGLDREGNEICEAKVIKILNNKSVDRTPLISIAVPVEFSMSVRFISLKTTEKIYLCRCEEITVDEVRELIKKGFTTLDEIKRITRAGMGSCQGRTCRQLIMQEIANQTGVKSEDQRISTFRPPIKPIKLGMLLEGEGDE